MSSPKGSASHSDSPLLTAISPNTVLVKSFPPEAYPTRTVLTLRVFGASLLPVSPPHPHMNHWAHPLPVIPSLWLHDPCLSLHPSVFLII